MQFLLLIADVWKSSESEFLSCSKENGDVRPPNRKCRTLVFLAGFMLVSQDTGIGQPDYRVSHLFPLESAMDEERWASGCFSTLGQCFECFDTVADKKDICHITACCFHQEFSLEQVEEENQWVLANPGSVGKWPLKWQRWHCAQLLTCEMSLQYLNCF